MKYTAPLPLLRATAAGSNVFWQSIANDASRSGGFALTHGPNRVLF